MTTTVQDLLKKKLPPTPSDQRMTREHTTGSVTHQIRHITDHAEAGIEQIGKLRVVDVMAAKKQAKRLTDVLSKLKDKVSKEQHG